MAWISHALDAYSDAPTAERRMIMKFFGNAATMPTQTNADRIRAMSDEELVEFLHKKPWLCESHSLCIDCPKYHKEKGCLSTDEWLQQPAEGVE